MAKFDRYTFLAPAGVRFELVLSRSTYSVAVYDRDGDRIAWSGRNWGTSLTDALSMAGYANDPARAAGGMWYLFGRIDGYHDGPSIVDLWKASRRIAGTEIKQDKRAA